MSRRVLKPPSLLIKRSNVNAILLWFGPRLLLTIAGSESSARRSITRSTKA